MKIFKRQLNTVNFRKKMSYMFIFLTSTLFLLYGFIIVSTIINIAEADTHSRDIGELQSEISELEIEYFEIVNTLSIDQAKIYGFSELSSVHYVHIDETNSFAYNS